ncbi:MAG: M14 family zinc carboxypeptidase [Acidobacteriota bacterium]
MPVPRFHLLLAAVLYGVAQAAAQSPTWQLPADHRALTRTVSFSEMEALLKSLDAKGPATVSVEGTSAGGRALYLVRLSRSATPAWRVLFYAQQHGDEVSGKDALLFLIRDVAARPELLPGDVDAWIMPMVNPDGAEAGTRRNSAGVDLNRDHIALTQPETRALHAVARRVRPHLAVDCHEFTRDSEARRERGWIAWPDITMDGLNNPLFDPAVIGAARRWVEESAGPVGAAGHRFHRYTVGGLPPDEEQRPSAPDLDSGLNAIGAHGGLSFIIEAAVTRNAGDPQADLGKRVDAYLVLLRRFLTENRHRTADLAAVENARRTPLPPFIPTNYLWVNPGMTVTDFPVLEVATGRTLRIPTANMMTTMAVKSAVPAPRGYAVEPRAAERFGALLRAHGIPFEAVEQARTVTAERCTLLRVEDDFDEVYSRYEGRQIVRRDAAGETALGPGSLWVPLDGEAAVRAALVLEPVAMYGLYQFPDFRALVPASGALPVVRVVR